MEEPFVLINAFEVSPEADEEFITGWEATRVYLETQPGYVDTTLHRAVSPNADFRFVNVARWQSPQQFHEAIQSEGFRAVSAPLATFRAHPGLYQAVSA
jgi:heme-degrading monooxygenase HmoA